MRVIPGKCIKTPRCQSQLIVVTGSGCQSSSDVKNFNEAQDC